MGSFRFKCKNIKCGGEFHRFYTEEEYDKLQDEGEVGISCFKCGTPRMIVMRSKKTVKDGFQPGFQRNIRKHCATYGEYKAWLKKLGLVEVGYEDLPPDVEGKTEYWTDDLIRRISSEYNLSITDGEGRYLKELNEV